MIESAQAPPRSPSPLDESSRPKRRWLRRTIVALVLAVVGSGAGFLVYLDNYAPLSADNGGGSWLAPSPAIHDFGDFSSPHGDSFQAIGVRCRVGVPIRFGITLWNKGPIGVTVRSIHLGPSEMVGARATRLGSTEAPHRFDPAAATPFQAFSLGSHDYRFVVIDAVMHSCNVGVFGFSQMTVDYSVLGIRHEMTVFLPYSFMVSRTGTRAF
jgi:hypothetical protein